MSDLDNVRVAVRIRPMAESEISRGSQVAVEKVPDTEKVLVNNTDAFTYNFVFDGKCSQDEVYKTTVSEMIDRLFCGFNATILAYGQTGSGKTYTMGTSFDGCLDEDIGVIPRAMQDIFERIEKCSDKAEFLVKCSFMELYQEQLYDLLSTKTKEESVVDLREDRSGVFFVGLTEEVVRTAKETTNCLMRGSLGRAVGATAMNQHSSRSHAIFTVILQATSKTDSQNVTTSKFHLVDLAGSERLKKVQFNDDRLKEGIKVNQDFSNVLSNVAGCNLSKQIKGDRFKEGVKINQGLLALGNVISALGDGKGGGFVRYRDSKLTRLLQDSLGGNSVTLMIACVSPADYNAAETLSTLRYADRARKIKNKPIINQDPYAAEINRLKGIIQNLKLNRAYDENMSSTLITELDDICTNKNPMSSLLPSEISCQQIQKFQEMYGHLQQQWYMTVNDIAEHEICAYKMETTQSTLKNAINDMKITLGDLIVFRNPQNEVNSDNFNLSLGQMEKLVNSMELEINRNEAEIMDQKKRLWLSMSLNKSLIANNVPDIFDLLRGHIETFTNGQIEIIEKLRRINHELNLKEQLKQRMTSNLRKFSASEVTNDEKIKKGEMKIRQLEDERCELLEKLQFLKKSDSEKVVEDVNKRLQTLEVELNDVKCSQVQQLKLLNIREKEKLKINKLNAEIQAMKESKLKLVHTIRHENENFRQFKKLRERELLQLRNKDQNLLNEMANKESLHLSQKKELDEKYEKVLAINNRLKDVLERQKMAQHKNQEILNLNNDNELLSKIDHLIEFLKGEFDLMATLVDEEISIEQFLKDRKITSDRIIELSELLKDSLKNTSVEQEIANLQEDLKIRNAQIDDIQKICGVDLESHICSVMDNVNSMEEGRAVIKYLWQATLNMRRENIHSIKDLKAQLSLAEEKCTALTKNIENLNVTYQNVLQDYEEKIALVLTPEQEQNFKQQMEQQKTIDILKRKLDNYVQLLQNNLPDSTSLIKDKMIDLKKCNKVNPNEGIKEFRDKQSNLNDISAADNCLENIKTEDKESTTFTDSNTSSVCITSKLIESSKINFKTSNTWKFFK